MKILIVKTSALGDVIQSFPVLDFLHQKFPNAHIDWVIEKSFKEIVSAHPKVHRVIAIESRKWKQNIYKHRLEIKEALHLLRKERYDLLIDLQGNLKSGILTKLARSKEKIGMTFSSAPEWISALFLTHRYLLNQTSPISLQYLSLVEQHLNMQADSATTDFLFQVSDEEKKWIASILSKNKKIMVCPGSHWENKKLAFSTWIQILTKERPCHFYFVWGSEKEREEASAFHRYFFPSSTWLPRLSMPVWQRLMTAMDCIYTVDSSALHLAGTTRTPTYSIFGPSSAAVYKPLKAEHKAFQAPCPYDVMFVKRCSILRTCLTGACLKRIFNIRSINFS